MCDAWVESSQDRSILRVKKVKTVMTHLSLLALGLFVAMSQAAQATPSQPVLPACFSTFEVTRETLPHPNDAEGGAVTIDSGQVRTDSLTRLGPTQQVLSISILTANTSTFVTDYLNGTASCVFSKGMFSPVTTLPLLSFVGTSVWAGEAVNHWTGTVTTSDQFDYYTLVSDNDLPAALFVTGANNSYALTASFSHTTRCQPGSVDPALFAVPAGLKCRPIPSVAMPAPASMLMRI